MANPTANVTGTFYGAEGGFHGYGAQLMVGDGASPEGFEAIAEVRSITFGDMTTAILDRTHLRSPFAHREKLAGLRDSGAFSLAMNWRPDHVSQTNAGGGTGAFAGGGLLRLWRDRVETNFILTVPYGSPEIELPFRGVVSKWQPGELGADGTGSLDVEITPLRDFSAGLP